MICFDLHRPVRREVFRVGIGTASQRLPDPSLTNGLGLVRRGLQSRRQDESGETCDRNLTRYRFFPAFFFRPPVFFFPPRLVR